MNTQRCRVQMLRAYFGEPEGAKCGLCDSCAGLDSEVFDPGEADQRTGLHAATDFHARPRRRRRGRGGEVPMPNVQAPSAPRPIVFETRIPGEVLPPLPPFEIPAPADSEATFDDGVWSAAGDATETLHGEPLHDDADAWLAEIMAASAAEPAAAPVNGIEVLAAPAAEADGVPPEGGEAAPAGDPFTTSWSSVRDANIRPYADWRAAPPLSLPVLQVRPQPQQQNNGHHGHHGGGGGGGRHQHQQQGRDQQGRHKGYKNGGGDDRGGRRGKRRGRNNDRQDRKHRDRDRDRGPRLPGFYNPGGD
jgi:hypothetical protein